MPARWMIDNAQVYSRPEAVYAKALKVDLTPRIWRMLWLACQVRDRRQQRQAIPICSHLARSRLSSIFAALNSLIRPKASNYGSRQVEKKCLKPAMPSSFCRRPELRIMTSLHMTRTL